MSRFNFRLDEDERQMFRLAAWLHDCGKVTRAGYIMDKATKLEVIYNRIHEIRMRFEALWRDAEIECLRARLHGGQLGTTERITALVDMFEALTAADRPYKPPKSLSESLGIMASMCRGGHLDPELFQYFLRSRVWLDYARTFMRPGQIDDVDAEALARAARAEESA